ncbi:MAG: terpene cyclase/mutase family protein [Fimbriimonas sp.]|nr:terpene cyclase/mutase family protein [Fimbriimonas sp.]
MGLTPLLLNRPALGAWLPIVTILPVAYLSGWTSSAKAPHYAVRAWSSQMASDYLTARASQAPCLSCHTTFPYVLAQPYLAKSANVTKADVLVTGSVVDRVKRWSDIQPYFTDKNSNPAQLADARGGEAVLNAMTLVLHNKPSGVLTADTKRALDLMWSLQTKGGENSGAWPWFRLGNEPWEADDSQYWGTALAALIVAEAPATYRNEGYVRQDLSIARAYLQKECLQQSILNQAGLLWIDGKIPLLTKDLRKGIADRILAKQHDDGGWSASSLAIPGLKRHDGTPQEAESDGYGTAIAVLALEKSAPLSHKSVEAGRAWLVQHQRPDGSWAATSLNARRDPNTDVGKFMTDAATAYAVIALSE